MPSSSLVRVFMLHVGFHAFWVFLYVVSLCGVFILIPLVGWYNAFVLGFLGNTVLASATKAAFLGFLVFGATGLLSAWLISLARPKSVWPLAVVSLAATAVLLVGASWMRYKAVGAAGIADILTLPATTGRVDVDELSMALKTEYDLLEPAVPPHLAGKGTVVPFSDLQPSLRLLPKDFQLKGGPYIYCNLSPQIWNALRRDAGAQKHPLLWSTQPEATGNRLVMSVDLKTDMFHDELITEEVFIQRLAQLEAAVRKQSGDAAFTIHAAQ